MQSHGFGLGRHDDAPSFEKWLPYGPLTSAKDRYPLIIFSHGFGGCAKQSEFLMKALAEDGYIVIAPNHADAKCNKGVLGFLHHEMPTEPFNNPDQWNDETYADRRADIERALDWALNDPGIGPRIDVQHMGLAGHSLGGYTVLGMAGAWPKWKDKRFAAVLALSPYSTPFLTNGDLAHMDVPVMYQGGTRDKGITPHLKEKNGVYDETSSPKFFVEFDGAGHFAFTALQKGAQDNIIRYALAFFDFYLKEQKSPLLISPPRKGVSDYKSAF